MKVESLVIRITDCEKIESYFDPKDCPDIRRKDDAIPAEIDLLHFKKWPSTVGVFKSPLLDGAAITKHFNWVSTFFATHGPQILAAERDGAKIQVLCAFSTAKGTSSFEIPPEMLSTLGKYKASLICRVVNLQVFG